MLLSRPGIDVNKVIPSSPLFKQIINSFINIQIYLLNNKSVGMCWNWIDTNRTYASNNIITLNYDWITNQGVSIELNWQQQQLPRVIHWYNLSTFNYDRMTNQYVSIEWIELKTTSYTNNLLTFNNNWKTNQKVSFELNLIDDRQITRSHTLLQFDNIQI